MTQAAQNLPTLAFLLGPNDSKDLVLVRNYGVKVVVLLSDSAQSEHRSISMTAKSAPEFLVPYVDDILDPALNPQYDEIQLYLTENNLGILGPLTSARAAYAMKHDGLTAGKAVDYANKVGVALSSMQAQRVATVQSLGLLPT